MPNPATKKLFKTLTKGTTTLHAAALLFKPATIKHLIKKEGIDINLPGKDKKTALIYAINSKEENMVIKNKLKIINILLNYKADPNQADTNGQTAWHHAAAIGDNRIIQTLFENSKTPPNIGKVDNLGRTPMHIAATNGHWSMALWLNNRGLGFDTADDDGHTPYQCAMTDEKVETTEKLLHKGAVIPSGLIERGLPEFSKACQETTLRHHQARQASPTKALFILSSKKEVPTLKECISLYIQRNPKLLQTAKQATKEQQLPGDCQALINSAPKGPSC